MKHFVLFCVIVLFAFTFAKADDERVFELRTYHAAEGKLQSLHSRFRDHTAGLFKKHGMTNVGYWTPVENEGNTLVYLMAYPNREARDSMWKAFLADPDWKKAYAESTKDGKLVTKVDSLFLKPTDYSPELKIAAADPARAFELRIYTTNAGKLADLHARFKNHTVALFEKHGLQNVAYFSILPDQEGAETKLVYFLAHKDQDTAKANFKAFSDDPDWQSAKKASEEKGPLLIKGGVSSTFLAPTDYSPLK